ncbi:MAG TPA: cache domain-containing protein, partial [Coleofasciculaceae cyanobacterium]
MSEVLPEAIAALRLRGKSVPLRWLLAIPVAVQLVGAIGLMSWLAWNHANQSLTEASTRLRQETTLRISQFLEGSLQAPLQVVQLMAQDSQMGRVDFRNGPDRERRLIEYFEVFKGTVDNVAYGGLDGEFAAVQFTDDRTSRQLQVAGRSTAGKMLGFDLDHSRKLSTVSRAFDPRQRSWYQDTIRSQRLVWNSVFQLHSSPQILALPVSQPVRDRTGRVIGVVTSRLYLSAVSQFLRALPIGRSG